MAQLARFACLPRRVRWLCQIDADEDQRAVHAIDLGTKKVLHTTKLDGTPSQLVLTADGRLVVALRDRSELAVFEKSGHLPFCEESEAFVARVEAFLSRR